MGSYIPNADAERRQMLTEAGCKDFSDLYRDIPESVRLRSGLKLPAGKSEMEVRDILTGLAAENKVYRSIFRGAGSYNHYIPAIVNSVVSTPPCTTEQRRRPRRFQCVRNENAAEFSFPRQ